jgi:hypothetical protein
MKNKNNPSKAYSLKWIKNNCYVYVWRYIKKANRNDDKKRFEWIYIGSVNGKGGEFIRTLSLEERLSIKKEIIFERHKRKLLERKIEEISYNAPYKDSLKEIMTIDNQELAKKSERELKKMVKKEAQLIVDDFFDIYTPETFYEFLKENGNPNRLYM